VDVVVAEDDGAVAIRVDVVLLAGTREQQLVRVACADVDVGIRMTVHPLVRHFGPDGPGVTSKWLISSSWLSSGPRSSARVSGAAVTEVPAIRGRHP
jgi:hypothetical protein